MANLNLLATSAANTLIDSFGEKMVKSRYYKLEIYISFWSDLNNVNYFCEIFPTMIISTIIIIIC